jgi:hypothetical protein
MTRKRRGLFPSQTTPGSLKREIWLSVFIAAIFTMVGIPVCICVCPPDTVSGWGGAERERERERGKSLGSLTFLPLCYGLDTQCFDNEYDWQSTRR